MKNNLSGKAVTKKISRGGLQTTHPHLRELIIGKLSNIHFSPLSLFSLFIKFDLIRIEGWVSTLLRLFFLSLCFLCNKLLNQLEVFRCFNPTRAFFESKFVAGNRLRIIFQLCVGIAYAGSAHTVLPLSDDPLLFETFLPALSTKVMPVDGKDPSNALDLAEQILSSDSVPGSILFFTDGMS